jgi:hypothetical protein
MAFARVVTGLEPTFTATGGPGISCGAMVSRRNWQSFLKHRPKEAIPPDPADLWLLFNAVRKRRPRVVLEFGAGCSTVAIAEGLRQNGSGFLYSLDGDSRWADITARDLPQSLRAVCKISYIPVVAGRHNGRAVLRHQKIPAVIPDMIYLDGPAFQENIEVAVDILDMEPRLPAGACIIVDGRWENTEYLRRNLKRPYRLKRRRALFNAVFDLA